MHTRQSQLVKDSVVAPIARDTYRSRAGRSTADLDLVSIELSLISAQARAAGMAGIEDNTDPAYVGLVAKIDSALVDVAILRALRTG